MKKLICVWLGAAGGVLACPGWDYEAHRAINQMALTALPTNFPAFVRSADAEERIGFLGGEMDRWRNSPDLPLKHLNNPDHYIDFEEVRRYGLDPLRLPVFRYDFVAELALVRKNHPDKFAPSPTEKNEDHTLELPGFLPWALAENHGKLKSGFSYLKAYRENGGTAAEIANAEANIVYIMGLMGHLAGDGSQPLHTTVHHHGWVGENPRNYATNRSIHSWIDGGYFQKTGGIRQSALKAKLRPASLVTLGGRDARPEEVFHAITTFVIAQHHKLEPLFELEKQGGFSGNGPAGLKGREFLEAQILSSTQFLADLWFTAWQQAPPDTWLIGQLTKRTAAVK